MVDLNALKLELACARRARRDAETAGLDLEWVIGRMQAGRSLQQIELEEASQAEAFETQTFAQTLAQSFRQAA